MPNTFLDITLPKNEPILDYAPNTAKTLKLKETIQQLKSETREIHSIISGKEVASSDTIAIHPPHEKAHQLGTFSLCNDSHIQQAIDGALEASKKWAATPWEQRAHIFLKAAELISSTYRYEINAATMLGQSKNPYQAEIDSACELIDFLRFNVHYLNEIYKQQPVSEGVVVNRLEYRPLEGFVFAVTPFNFTAIGANLAAAPAMCGNVVIWKPSYTQIYSAHVVMKVFKEAGLPDGVIQFVLADGQQTGNICCTHKDFAALHFTGSTRTFNTLWKQIAQNLDVYKSYPRIVGETGGKDFVFVHPSADVDVAATALLRGSYEYQGQKCSAASRAYLPKSLAENIVNKVIAGINEMKVGTVEDFSNFMNAVIDKKSYEKITSYIDGASNTKEARIVAGGKYNQEKGYFVYPTLIEAFSPQYKTMCEEIFGPVLTYYVYEDNAVKETLHTIDTTSPYALTGSVIAQDRYAIEHTMNALEYAAGNFYVNDKPTGAVVGQQPFGGARRSGTNDKAGSPLNLYRWLSPRTVKETLVPAKSYKYPFLG